MKQPIYTSNIEIIKNLRLISEQDDEYYKIDPKELKKLIDISDSILVTKLPKFGGKKLYVTGTLSLEDKKISNLGNIGYVDGNLNISHTNISSTEGVIVKGHISDWGTPRQKIRERKELEAKKEAQNELRESGEWNLENPNIDSEGLKANALYRYLVDEGDIEEVNIEEVQAIKQELETLNKRYKEEEDDEIIDQLSDRISELESELDDLSEITDVYDMCPVKYTNYGLTMFEVLNSDLSKNEYCVGTSDEMDEALENYYESYVDDMGLDGFREHTLEDALDTDQIRDYFETHYYDDVRENPESFFSDDDFQLTDEQEKRTEQLEKYIEDMETLKSELEDERNELEHGSDEYNNLDERIDEIGDNIDKAQAELDSIEIDKEPTEDMIEEKVQEIVDDMMSNPLQSLKHWGLDIKDFIDTKELVEILVREGGWGDLNSYDGDYTSVTIKDEDYYVMRTN